MTLIELAPGRPGIDAPRGQHHRKPTAPQRDPLHLRLRPSRDLLLISAIAAIAAVVRCWGLFNFPALADDEGTYAAQAQAVRWGELAHYTYWYDHPPLGWIQLGALDWIPQHLLPGTQPVAASRLIVVLSAVLSTALCYPLARRMACSRTTATTGALLAALSPLAVTLQRQVYLDTLSTAWVLVAFLLAFDRRQRLWAHVGAGVCFAIAVLTKETNAVLLIALLWAVLQNSGPRTRKFSVVGLLGAFTLVVAYYPLMALLRGELLSGAGHVSLAQGVMFQLHGRDGSGALWQAGSSANTVLHGWLFFDGWIIVLGVLSIPVALAARRLRPVAVALLILVLVGARPGGYLPAMYVLTMIPFLALTTAGAGELLWRMAGRASSSWLCRALRGGCVTAVVVALAFLGPQWAGSLHGAFTQRTNDDRVAAERWLAANSGRNPVILTDDVSWLALVQHRVTPRPDVIWFYKLDTDPALKPLFPGGWQDVDYVLSTDQLRLAVAGDPLLLNSAAALRESTVVASFGTGGSVVEVRRVKRPTTSAPSASNRGQ